MYRSEVLHLPVLDNERKFDNQKLRKLNEDNKI